MARRRVERAENEMLTASGGGVLPSLIKVLGSAVSSQQGPQQSIGQKQF